MLSILFDVMAYFLMSLRTFIFVDIMQYILKRVMPYFLHADVMMHFYILLRHGVLLEP